MANLNFCLNFFLFGSCIFSLINSAKYDILKNKMAIGIAPFKTLTTSDFMICLGIYSKFCPISFDTKGIAACEIKRVNLSYQCNFYNTSFSMNSLVSSATTNIYIKQSEQENSLILA